MATIGTERTSKRKSAKPSASLMEQAYSRLRREILSCRLTPGSEISETELADLLNVSKTPVREALGRLAVDGFVRAIPRRGYQIAPLTISDMNELFDLRTVVETGVVELAITKISDEQLDELTALADATYDQRALSSLDHFIAANRDFHLAIARSTGNSRLIQVTTRELDELERYFYVGAQLRDVSPEAKSEHHQIVEALRAKDVGRCRQLIVDHNTGTRRGLLDHMTNGGLRSYQIGFR